MPHALRSPEARIHQFSSRLRTALILILFMNFIGCAGVSISSSGTNDSRSQKAVTNTQSTTNIYGLSSQAAGSVGNRIPTPGTEVTVTDSLNGKQMRVIFGESYVSASGRRCAYYFETGASANTRNRPAGVTCHHGDGGWIRASSRIPVNIGP